MKIGIALGSGGAKGLAHIPMLEVIDELGLEIHQIAGTSIGAIIGVLYASGYSALEIRQLINYMSYMEGDTLIQAITEKDIFRWFEYINVDWNGNSLLKADKFISDLMDDVKYTQFEDLPIPLKIVAADFWKRDQVVFESGDIRQAVQASMALPGVFAPVVLRDQVLIDGGAVNPVPFDVLNDCDIVIAINVMGKRTENKDLVPTYSETVFNTFQIMQTAILKQKIAYNPPDIIVTPEVVDIRMLEFYKADEIFRQSEPTKELLRNQLGKLLEKKAKLKH